MTVSRPVPRTMGTSQMPAPDGAGPEAGLWWSLTTPAGARGALACMVLGPNASGALRRLGLPDIEPGKARVLDVPGVDQMVIVRWGEALHIMPHGGPAVMRGVIAWVESRAFARLPEPPPRAIYPEASSDLEAWMLRTLARAASPAAIPTLLAQPSAWSRVDGRRPLPDDPLSREFRRLIEPPLVVVVGPPNIGKSSLLNALAGRRVAIVADEPGTTRDHVGALVELDGLVVRWADTPGVRANAGGAEAAALEVSRALLPHADLLLVCSDPGDQLPPAVAETFPPGGDVLRVGLRSDLGRPLGDPEVCVSLKADDTLAAFARRVRGRLVRDGAMKGLEPLWFWPPDAWGGP